MAAEQANIKTTVVGSYPVPEWLLRSPTQSALIDATRVVLATQEHAGLDLVCDGELYRFDPSHPETNGMIEYFVQPMSGIRMAADFEEKITYRQNAGMRFRSAPPGVVDGPIGHGGLDLPNACRQAAALATRPFKFTATGPHMLAKTLVDNHYGSVEAVADAIADVLAGQIAECRADVIQLDEANLPGHPEEWPWAAAAMNKVLDAVTTTAAVHLCFGNYGGQSVQSGTWAALIAYLNALHVDHVVLECRRRPEEELQVFKDLRPEIGFGMGVVDIKDTAVESADAIARQIERAETVLGPGRVRYIHPDCGFWMLKRSIADAKIQALAAGRDLFEGRTLSH